MKSNSVDDKAQNLYVSKIRNQIANAITITNLALGCASIFCSINNRIGFAITAIGFAGLGDRFDGRIARRMGTESPLGIQLDSMSDAVSFGVAPAVLVYMLLRPKYAGGIMHPILALICSFYIICGLFRLARYNVSGLDDDGNFHGLPITAAGSFTALCCIIYKSLPPVFFLILLPLLSFFMISKIKIRKK